MTLGLHPDCKARLVEFIKEKLPALLVDNGRYVDFDSTHVLLPIDEILPAKGKVRDQLLAFSDDRPLYEFVVDMVVRALWMTEDYQSESDGRPLSQFGAFSDISDLAKFFVDTFDGLPFGYSYTFKLPFVMPETWKFGKQIVFSGSVRIVQPDAALNQEYPLKTRTEKIDKELFHSGMLPEQDPKLDEESWYFQCRMKGYVTRYGTDRTTAEAKALLKTFVGLGIALRLLEYKRTYQSFSYPIRTAFFVHDFRDGGWRLNIKGDLEVDISEAMTNVHILEHDAIGADQQATWIAFIFAKMRTCLMQPKKAEKVLQASTWLFDSYVSRNELLAFVQTTVALEILFGDKSQSDLMGLGELLRNRCAYLIGKTQEQRQGILKDFSEIYSVRSQIVHRGKNRLTEYERSLFLKLRWMCARSIQEEIELIEKDVEEAEAKRQLQISSDKAIANEATKTDQ